MHLRSRISIWCVVVAAAADGRIVRKYCGIEVDVISRFACNSYIDA